VGWFTVGSMSDTITTQATFEQKLLDRIRASIGELVSDEDLKKILERGVEAALFKGAEKKDYYGRTETVYPSFVEKAVSELLGAKMQAAVDGWIRDNQERFLSAVDEAVKLGVGRCLLSALDSRMNDLMYNLRSEMATRVSG
jgi:hypothetical protein